MFICLDQRNSTGCSAQNDNSAQYCVQCGRPLRFALMLRDPGATVGNYRIVCVIGYGSFGAVYEAEPISGGAHVAIKETFDPTNLHGLQREFDLLCHLRHANLPRYDAVFEAQGNGYLVMEYIPGQNLEDVLCKQHGALAEAQVLSYALQLCAALTFLHSQHPPLLHRDIKPANIRLTPEGLIKLVDFGLVKQNGQQTRATIRGFGTAAYAPLEQYGQSNEQTDPRSDIYSLGATLYHLLTGQEPVAAPVRIATTHDPLTTLRILNPAISSNVDGAILQAMELRQHDRFASADAFRAALLGKQSPSGPVAPSRATPALPQTAIAPTVRVNTTSAVGGGVPGGLTTTQPTAPRQPLPIIAIALVVVGLLVAIIVLGTRSQAYATGDQSAVEPTVVQGVPITVFEATIEAATAQRIEPTAPTIVATSQPPIDGIGSSVGASGPPTPELVTAEATSSAPTAEPQAAGALPMSTDAALRPIAIDAQADLAEPLLVSVRQTDKSWRVAIAMPNQPDLRYVETGGAALQPQLSPDGRLLAFTSNRAGYDAVYILDVASGVVRQLTPPTMDSQLPAWSPDSQALVYTAAPRGGSALDSRNYIIALTSDTPRQLSDHHGGWVDWSRNDVIVFTGWTGKSFDLFRIKPDGNKLTNLTNSDDLDEDIPTWSADGSQIAFVRSLRSDTTQRQIFVMEQGGADIHQLTVMAGPNSNPVWSPAGETIAFVNQPTKDVWQPWIIPAQGGTPRRLSTNEDRIWFMHWVSTNTQP